MSFFSEPACYSFLFLFYFPIGYDLSAAFLLDVGASIEFAVKGLNEADIPDFFNLAEFSS